MTSVQWMKLLGNQARDFNKTVFTITELTSLCGLKRSSLAVQLTRLTKSGVFIRYGHGLYGIAEQPPELVVGYMDAGAYCTGHYALFKYGNITQAPTRITCFTNRHHGRSRIVSAGANTYEFVKPAAGIYHRPGSGALASCEQALCDFIFICRNRGVTPAQVVTLRNMVSLDRAILDRLLANYPATVRGEVVGLLGTS